MQLGFFTPPEKGSHRLLENGRGLQMYFLLMIYGIFLLLFLGISVSYQKTGTFSIAILVFWVCTRFLSMSFP